MPLLKPKKDYTSRFGIIFKRVMRPIGESRAYCSHKEDICSFYKNDHQLCVRNWAGNTTLYCLCSYVNQYPSSYIYAPQKTI